VSKQLKSKAKKEETYELVRNLRKSAVTAKDKGEEEVVGFAEGVHHGAQEGIGRFKDVIGLSKDTEAKDEEETVGFAEGVRQLAHEGIDKFKDVIGFNKDAEAKGEVETVGFAEGVRHGAKEVMQEASAVVAGASSEIKGAIGLNKGS